MDYYEQKVRDDKRKAEEAAILNWGQSCDLDQCEEAYRLGGTSVTWSDYTYDWFNALSESEQMEHLDNAWDMDKYYADFYTWWDSIGSAKRSEIYKQIMK